MNIRKTGTDQEIYAKALENLTKNKSSVSEYDKRVFLISNGFYKLIEGKQGEGNSYKDSADNKYWKKVPIQISDDEYLKLQEIYNNKQEKDYVETSAATIIGTIIIVLGLFVALIILLILPVIGLGISIMVGLSSILFGVLYISLGSILYSLEKTRQTLKSLSKEIISKK